MDSSGAGQAPQQQSLQPQQQAALIRPEQVKKLPHLPEGQKPQYEQMVQRLWDAMNGSPQNSENWNKALAKLSQISKQLMTGMRQWQANRQANAGAQPGGTVAPPPQQQPAGPITDFSQLLPAIQARVNAHPIIYPPNVKQGTPQAAEWLREAKMRFGQALQRLEMGKMKIGECNRLVQQREAAGNPLNANETQQLQTRIAQYKKNVAESTSFLERFKAQQASFKQEHPAQPPPTTAAPPTAATPTAPAPPSTGPQIDGAVETPAAPPAQPNGQGPAAHTISSAVNAARNQANAQQAQAAAMSPAVSAPPMQQPNGVPVPTSGPPGPPGIQAPPPAPSPYNATSGQADLSGSAQAAIQQQQQMNGGPRALSQSAAVQQAAQNYANNPPQPPQPATTVHGHPPYMQQASFVKKDDRMKISPHLNTKPHEPVTMAPGRPTLTGGPSVGAIGQMGQPAIPKMPGYVLEGAGNERVLSKNKLTELVREVTGAGPEDGDQLSPEAEEILLSLADNFVDDLVTASCKLAKLRGQSVLDIRDIQVILERQYNIRIPGYSTDEIRTVRRIHPNVEYLQKMGAVQAAKVTGGGSYGASLKE